MTEIDVPDWVVKAAEDARVRCLNAVTAYGSAGVDERYHMAMKAAITAALGAWVVPVMWKHERCGWTPINEALIATRGQINYAYTLRQEKPE